MNIIPLSRIINREAGLERSHVAQGWDFTAVPPHGQLAVKMSGHPGNRTKCADGPTPAPASPEIKAAPPAPDPPAPAAKPTLAVSGDTYTDTATESHKYIGFDVTVPSPLVAADYALVNHLKGSQKKDATTYFKVKMYGSVVDFNFPSWQVDSLDADPVYGSDSSARRNYTSTATGFSSSDDPGPALSSEHGAVYAVNFKIGLYKLADLPTTTSGTISATAIAEVPWQYSVKVSSSGTFTHPAL